MNGEYKMDRKQEILNKLSAGVIASPDDLIGMGECLNLLDELESIGLTPSEADIVSNLREVMKRLILEDSPDVSKDWEEVEKLITKLSSEEESDTGEPKRQEEVSSEEPSADVGEEAEPVQTKVLVDDPDLLKDFLDEAREHLDEIEINMVTLEENPEDREVVNAIFRPFHSIKGVAGFLNLKDIHKLSHEVETLLDGARSGDYPVTRAIIDIVLQSVDILKDQLAIIEDGIKKGEIQVEGDPQVHSFLNYIRNFDPTKEFFIDEVAEYEKIFIEKDVLEEGKEVKEIVSEAPQEDLTGKSQEPSKDLTIPLTERKKFQETSTSIRVDTAKLDNLVDMIGELVIAQSMVLQNPEVQKIKNQKFHKDIVQLRRITGELQRISTSLRMIPIKSTFQKMIRLVRDLSRKFGKEVALKMYGEDTEIDRNMVDQIYEPLVHMIRNAIDHGIETPEERTRLGKPTQGTIIIAAEQKSGNIVIDVKDDGQGLDAQKILNKAIERGIISPNESLKEEEVFQLIFQPGFSTKESVTDVSGRGVGMDVVKRCVENLRGKIEVKSTLGNGSHFQIKLPLTMAIIDGMIIRIGSERYVIPTISLKESLRPSQEDYRTIQGKGEMINVRGTLMPLIRLYQLFDIEPKFHNPWDALLLVVNEDGRNYCFLADEILGRQEVVIKSLGGIMKQVTGISGGAILGDGKVALILDVKGIALIFKGKHR